MRIWSLDPTHARQPCAAILEGDGHKETVLTVVGVMLKKLRHFDANYSQSFHQSGRYLLSGGIDHIINLVSTLPRCFNVLSDRG